MSAQNNSRLDLPAADAPNFSQRVRETLMTYLGRTGNANNRGLTVGDLAELGIINTTTDSNGNTTISAGSSSPSSSTGSSPAGGTASGSAGSAGFPVTSTANGVPPTPTGFYASAGLAVVFFGTANPTFTGAGGYAGTNIYAATVPSSGTLPTFSGAARIDSFIGSVGSMASDPATTWCLWVTWVGNNGAESLPAGGTNGLQVTTGQDVSKLLKALTGKLTAQQLYTDLSTAIGYITAPASTPNSMQSLLAYAANTASQAYSAVQVTATTVAGLSAEYTVKVDVNGYVSGFGLASTTNGSTPTSTFAVRSDAFYIASPSGPGISPSMPFIVYTTPGTINGVSYSAGVYMNSAFIQNGSITTAMIGNAAIGTAQIQTGAITNALIGTAAVGTANIQTAAIGTAQIANAAVTGSLIAGGTITAANVVSSGITSAVNITTNQYGLPLAAAGLINQQVNLYSTLLVDTSGGSLVAEGGFTGYLTVNIASSVASGAYPMDYSVNAVLMGYNGSSWSTIAVSNAVGIGELFQLYPSGAICIPTCEVVQYSTSGTPYTYLQVQLSVYLQCLTLSTSTAWISSANISGQAFVRQFKA